MDLELAGRAILVTGGARGIGAAITRVLAAEGAIPIVVDRDAGATATLAGEVAGAITIVAELRDPDACRDAVAEAVRRAGRLETETGHCGRGAPGAPDAQALDRRPRRGVDFSKSVG